MPYLSSSQRAFAHTDIAKKKGFPTAEFDKASKGIKGLPAHVKGKGKKRAVKFSPPTPPAMTSGTCNDGDEN